MSDTTPVSAPAGMTAAASPAAPAVVDSAAVPAAPAAASAPMQTDTAAPAVDTAAATASSNAPAGEGAAVASPATAAAATATTGPAAAAPAPAPVAASAPAGGQGKGKGRSRDWQSSGGNKRQKNDKPGNQRNWLPRSKPDGGDAGAGAAKDGDASDDEDGGGAGGGRVKKRKVALAVMYRGTAYCGLQLQNGAQQAGQATIERALLDGIHAAGGITKDNMDSTHKIKWQRAARTDKGVHAAGNVMSLMLCCDAPPPPDCPSQSADIVERINACLPEDVRVIGYARALGGFHAKYSCTSRMYEYILPSFVFDSDPETLALLHEKDDWMAPASGSAAEAAAAPFVYPQRLLDYRLTEAKRAELRDIMSCMKGTLNFQNFTRKKSSFLKEAQKDAARAKAAREAAGGNAESAAAPQERKGKKEDGSDEEGEGMDDAAEEALERQQYAAAAAAAAASAGAGTSAPAASAAASSSAAPSPFSITRIEGRRAHNPLLVHLKALNTRAGSQSGTNKASGQFARFIRYIMDFDIEDVYMHSLGQDHGSSSSSSGNGAAGAGAATAAAASAASPAPCLEFVRLRVHGQSFILNQIRKMVGALVIIARGQLPRSYLTEKALKFDEYAVPTAPSLGLLLDRPVYADYDRKVGGGGGGGGAIADRMPVGALFTTEPYASRVEDFRSRCIYKQICDAEVRSGSAAHWCARLWDSPACMQLLEDEKEEKEREEQRQVDEKNASAVAAATDANAGAAASVAVEQTQPVLAAAATSNDTVMADATAVPADTSASAADAPIVQQ